MKKKMIAAGAASLALAAMPVVGVFAAASQVTSVTDNVQLTVTGACKMMADASTHDSSHAVNLGSGLPGTTFGGDGSNYEGTPMTITCNTETGFTLSANATALADGSKPAINFGAWSDAGGSVWSAKITKTGTDSANATIAQHWDDYSSPSSAQDTDTTILTTVQNTGVVDLEVTPHYKAYAATNQPAGTYTGTITYTFGGEYPVVQNP